MILPISWFAALRQFFQVGSHGHGSQAGSQHAVPVSVSLASKPQPQPQPQPAPPPGPEHCRARHNCGRVRHSPQHWLQPVLHLRRRQLEGTGLYWVAPGLDSDGDHAAAHLLRLLVRLSLALRRMRGAEGSERWWPSLLRVAHWPPSFAIAMTDQLQNQKAPCQVLGWLYNGGAQPGPHQVVSRPGDAHGPDHGF